MTEILLEIFMLASALSVDAFAVSFSYGMNRIKIPASSVLILASISSLTLAVSLSAGNLLSRFLTEHLAGPISFLILFFLGIIKLFDQSGKEQAERANKDHDNLLSASEAIPLGAALSIDSIAAGIGAGFFPSHLAGTILASFFMGIAAILSGSLLGRKLSRHINTSLCWICGAMLMILAFMKLF